MSDKSNVTMDALHDIITVHKENNEFDETINDSIDGIKVFKTQAFDVGLPNTTTSILKCVQSELSKQEKSAVDDSNCFSLEQLPISLTPSEVSLQPSRVEVAFSETDNIKQNSGDEVEE